MREKTRYLKVLFQKEAGEKIDSTSAKHLVYNAVFELLGEEGAASAQVHLKEYDEEKQLAAIKCRNAQIDLVISALALKRFDAGKSVALRLQKISGAIKNVL